MTSGGPGGTPMMVIQVPDERCGAIIGRGGATIKLLQDRTGARIQVPKEGQGGLRNVSISGPTEQSVTAAHNEIQMLLAQEAGRAALPGSTGGLPPTALYGGGMGGGYGAPSGGYGAPGGGYGGGYGGGGGAPQMLSGTGGGRIQIQVTDERAGAIIGRAGATIKLLQERSGCQIKVPPSGQDGIRIVDVMGSPAGCEIARSDITAILAGPPGSGAASLLAQLGPGAAGGMGGGYGQAPPMGAGGYGAAAYGAPARGGGQMGMGGGYGQAAPAAYGGYAQQAPQQYGAPQQQYGGYGAPQQQQQAQHQGQQGGQDSAAQWAAYTEAMRVYHAQVAQMGGQPK